MQKIISVKKCPVCNSRRRKFMYARTMDNIESRLFKCSSCKLIYNGIKLSDKNSKILDNKFAEFNHGEFLRWKRLNENRIKNIEKITGKRTGRLLDVGCGNGSFVEAAKERGWDAYGTEPFTKTYKFAKKRGLNVKNCFLRNSNLPSNFFDIITATEVVEHFDNPIAEFKEMKRILKNDGQLIIETANSDSIISKLKRGKRKYIYYDHLCYFSIESMNNLLQKIGMKITRAIPDEINLKERLRWCKTHIQKIKWIGVYLARAILLNKPIIGSMTLYIKKRGKANVNHS